MVTIRGFVLTCLFLAAASCSKGDANGDHSYPCETALRFEVGDDVLDFTSDRILCSEYGGDIEETFWIEFSGDTDDIDEFWLMFELEGGVLALGAFDMRNDLTSFYYDEFHGTVEYAESDNTLSGVFSGETESDGLAVSGCFEGVGFHPEAK